MLRGPAIDLRQNKPSKWPSAPWPDLIYERDDGQFQLGLCDDVAGPFPSRAFAQAVAAKEARHHAAS
jgi:hypothetical protein